MPQGNYFPSPPQPPSPIESYQGDDEDEEFPGLRKEDEEAEKRESSMSLKQGIRVIRQSFRVEFAAVKEVKEEMVEIIDRKLDQKLALLYFCIERREEQASLIFDHLHRHNQEIAELKALTKQGTASLAEEEKRLRTQVILSLCLNQADVYEDLKRFVYVAALDTEGNRGDGKDKAAVFAQEVFDSTKSVRFRSHQAWKGTVAVVFRTEKEAERFDSLFNEERVYILPRYGTKKELRCIVP
uniref:Uncharacterized protein n=1 Tax=Chromera velia CCMP2878 TaxID=1169474 RepID=A0A0G4IA24_9ALVE|eukprot:Cvel_12432.t1-p1 / transcript=Cvel_12432.t1 / gene=Cvel_12432 / organism=Chromera_velia_CCMP2878 / gene_product=hypothetical protein / transcript_product=hypothetical protein / location=Cvel_scaffold813:45268-45987(-) / protein_length=240 / sequence_SO=supercontig / SO=protein_coding / is_pseudo=false